MAGAETLTLTLGQGSDVACDGHRERERDWEKLGFLGFGDL